MNKVIALENSKGHLQWKIADLARSTKTSRATVYYHFGKTKAEIMKNCLALIVEEYFAFSDERRDWMEQGKLLESLLETRRMYLRNPDLIVFFHRWRMKPSPIQELFLAVEKRYMEKIKKVYPHLSSQEVEIAYAVFHGLVTAPFLSPRALSSLAPDLLKKVTRTSKS